MRRTDIREVRCRVTDTQTDKRPRCACAPRVNKTTYSASGIGQKVCGVLSETAGFESYGVKYKRTSSGSASSVYLEGIRSHNDGRVSTPACYLLLVAARVRLSARETTNSAAHPPHSQFAEGLHFSAFCSSLRSDLSIHVSLYQSKLIVMSEGK